MENQNQPVDLEKEIWKEADILDLLGLTRVQLDRLRRERGFPVVQLGQRNRVYLARDILGYVQSKAGRQE